MKIAYADCYSGISGDMFLAALLDAGLPLAVLQAGIEKLNLPEKVELKLTETHKGALRAANLEVIVPHSHHHRDCLIFWTSCPAAGLSDPVKQTASRIFTLLAEAEARVHGEPVETDPFSRSRRAGFDRRCDRRGDRAGSAGHRAPVRFSPAVRLGDGRERARSAPAAGPGHA